MIAWLLGDEGGILLVFFLGQSANCYVLIVDRDFGNFSDHFGCLAGLSHLLGMLLGQLVVGVGVLPHSGFG